MGNTPIMAALGLGCPDFLCILIVWKQKQKKTSGPLVGEGGCKKKHVVFSAGCLTDEELERYIKIYGNFQSATDQGWIDTVKGLIAKARVTRHVAKLFQHIHNEKEAGLLRTKIQSEIRSLRRCELAEKDVLPAPLFNRVQSALAMRG